MSNLCGFKTYSHRANTLTIMETPENVNEFLDLLSNKIKSKANNDLSLLRDFKASTISNNPLMQWDIPYLTRKYKKQK